MDHPPVTLLASIVTGWGASVADASGRVHIEPGQTLHETISLVGAFPLALRLIPERTLQEGETVSLSVKETDRQWNLDVHPATLRHWDPVRLRVPLTRNTRELRVETSLGLSGTLAVTEADLVPGGMLSLELKEPGGH